MRRGFGGKGIARVNLVHRDAGHVIKRRRRGSNPPGLAATAISNFSRHRSWTDAQVAQAHRSELDAEEFRALLACEQRHNPGSQESDDYANHRTRDSKPERNRLVPSRKWIARLRLNTVRCVRAMVATTLDYRCTIELCRRDLP